MNRSNCLEYATTNAKFWEKNNISSMFLYDDDIEETMQKHLSEQDFVKAEEFASFGNITGGYLNYLYEKCLRKLEQQ